MLSNGFLFQKENSSARASEPRGGHTSALSCLRGLGGLGAAWLAPPMPRVAEGAGAMGLGLGRAALHHSKLWSAPGARRSL